VLTGTLRSCVNPSTPKRRTGCTGPPRKQWQTGGIPDHVEPGRSVDGGRPTRSPRPCSRRARRADHAASIGESIQRRRCALGTWPDLRPNGARTRHIGTRADVVVLDLALPDTDGWEIARRLKGSPTTAAVPIIALTGATLPHERASAMRAGCDQYFTKPCVPTDVLRHRQVWEPNKMTAFSRTATAVPPTYPVGVRAPIEHWLRQQRCSRPCCARVP